MPLRDDSSLPAAPEDAMEDAPDRRRFLDLVGAGALGAALVGTGVLVGRFLAPQVQVETTTRVAVGRPESFAPGTVLALPERGIYVVRTARGFLALSSVCSHLGCMTRYQPALARIACPCHGSRFGLDGSVEAGPAPRPLAHVAITLERGVLVVDTARRVAPGTLLEVS